MRRLPDNHQESAWLDINDECASTVVSVGDGEVGIPRPDGLVVTLIISSKAIDGVVVRIVQAAFADVEQSILEETSAYSFSENGVPRNLHRIRIANGPEKERQDLCLGLFGHF